MAKQYEDFKKEFASLQDAVNKCNDEIDKNTRFISQTSGVIQEGSKEVGLRIQQLKKLGETGTKIKDFESDAQIKKMMASLHGFLGGVQKELARIAAVHAGPMAQAKTRYVSLKKDLTAEIASRKKQNSTKVGLGNKSLPDMVKLLDQVTKYQDIKPFSVVHFFVPEKYADHVTDFDRGLQRQIDQTKAAALNAFQDEMRMQGLNPRVLIGRVAEAKQLYVAVMKQCKEVEDAAQKQDKNAVVAAKAEVMKPMRDLSVLVDPYEKAKTDTWIKSFLATSNDKAKIEAGIEGMIKMKAAARAELQKVSHL